MNESDYYYIDYFLKHYDLVQQITTEQVSKMKEEIKKFFNNLIFGS